jgi:hypothetical protein
MTICVVWNKKKVSAQDRAQGLDYTGAQYQKLGNALYKMYQMNKKGYDGVHMDIHNTTWTYNGQTLPNSMVEMYEKDGKWYLDHIDITDEIEYFQKYRCKETA